MYAGVRIFKNSWHIKATNSLTTRSWRNK